MVAKKHEYNALVLIISFSFSFAFAGLLAFGNISTNGNAGVSNGKNLNNTIGDMTPVASDTKNPSHNWKGIVALNSWWNTAWTYRQMINFTEPGLMDRLNDPENVYMTFGAGLAHNNSIRVTCFVNTNSSWLEIPSQVWNATFSGAFYTKCTIFFFLNLTKGTTETYYIYYDSVINTKPTYPNHIYLRGYNDPAIPADTTNPSFTSFYYNNNTKPAYNNVNSIQIIVNNNTATPRAKVCLVPTVRAGSDWGGPSQAIYSATQGLTDSLNLAQKEWESVGELALQAANDTVIDGAGASEWERLNVGPDNPAEAWDGHGGITVLADGPLFCQFKIRTTDGAYNNAPALGTAWQNGGYIDAFNGSVVADAVNRGNDGYTYPGGNGFPAGTNVCNVGGVGYAKYNITYTFYYQQATPSQMFSRVDMSIGSFPQRGPVGSRYPHMAANYAFTTGVCFKNYGDWPHILQLVAGAANATNLLQNYKAWNGTKYGLDTIPLEVGGAYTRKCDYPLEPWQCWYDSANANPTIGLMAITNSIGWQVLSLAVAGIGPNTLLQQILPEGLQGSLYQIPNGVILSYTYYTMTSPGGSNYTSVRDMTRRLNKPASISPFGSTEVYTKNQVWVRTLDKSGAPARGVQVALKVYSGYQTVNATSWASFLQVPDGTYTVQVIMLTNNFKTNYTVYSQSLTLNHATTRYYYITATCNMANLTMKVVNWAKSNQLLTGVQVSFINTTSLAIVEQNYTWNGVASFRLYTTGATTYSIQLIYGGTNCTGNYTNPVTLTGNTQLNVGLDIQTTAITMNSQPASVTFGGNYTVSFYFNNFGDTSTKYRPTSITVSNLYGSKYWPGGTGGMYNWSVSAGNLISLTLATGASKWLNKTGNVAVFIHAINSTVIPAVQQISILINPIPTNVKFTLNNTVSNSISLSRGSFVQLKVSYLNGLTPIVVTTAANVNYTLNAGTTTIPWIIANNNYTVTIPTNTLASGTYVVTISAFQPNYAQIVTSFAIIVTLRPSTIAPGSPGTIYYGTTFNIPFTLIDGTNGTGISTITSRLDANVKNYPGINEISITGSLGSYQVNYNSTSFPALGSYLVYINWTAPVSYPYYQNCYSSITITISQRLSQLTYTPPGNVAYGENVLVSVNFADGVNGTGISNVHSTVNCNVTGFTAVYQGGGNYLVTFSTLKLGSPTVLGTYYANISTSYNQAFVPYYKSQWVNVKVVVINRPTQLIATSPAATQYNQAATFTVTYSDLNNGSRIFGAGVTIACSNTTIISLLSTNQYNITVNTNQFAAIGTYYIPITATYTSGIAPYYSSNQIIVKLVVVQRQTTLTTSKESNPQFGASMMIDITFQDALNNSYININPNTQLSVSVVGFSNVTIIKTGSNGVYTANISTNQLPRIGIYSVNVIASWSGKPFYSSQTQTVSVTVTQRNAILNPGSEIYTTYGYNVKFNVSLYYQDVINGSTITKGSAIVKKVTANHLGTNVPTVNTADTPITYYSGIGWKITFNSSNFVTPGLTYTVVVQMNWSTSVKPFYINNTISFSITVSVASTQIVEIGSFTAPSNQNQTLYFQYINSQSGTPIGGATIEVNNTFAGNKLTYGGGVIWNGTASYNGTHYKLVFNSTALSGNGLHPFIIKFSETNYNIASFNFTLINTALGSQLQLVSVQSNRILGQNISMIVSYKYQGSANGILKASLNVTSNLSSLYWGYLTEFSYTSNGPGLGNGLYNLTILHTGTSAPRVNSTQFYKIYIDAYTSTTTLQVVNVQFQLLQIPTNISRVFFNGTDRTSNNPSYTTQITKSINVTVEFDQLFPNKQNITASPKLVYLSSTSLPSNINFTLIGSRYSLVFPASELGVGTAFLFVIAQKANYAQSSKTIQITVTQVSTTLTLILNNTQRSTIQVSYGQNINVSALYKNTVDNVYITDPKTSITLSGGSHATTWNLTVPSGNYWRYILNSRLLGVPASYTMTLSASRANFTTSSIVFTIQVVQVPTSLINMNASSISVIWGATFRIYVSYQDNLTNIITGASVVSSPIGNQSGSFVNPSYWMQYNASQFGAPQTYNLVISVVKGNYTSQSITISVDVSAIPTTLASFKSGGGVSTYFVVNWSNNINIVMRFTDTLHAGISVKGATISAGSKNSSITSVIYSATSGNYTLEFNSTILGTPNVYQISLTFSKANYATQIVAITIQVSGPGTSLVVSDQAGKTMTQITLYYPQPLVFGARMRDLNHSAYLSSWSDSESLTPNTDFNYGIYHNMTFSNLIPGLYTITITGTKVNFTSASTTITVVVNPSPTGFEDYFNGVNVTGSQSASFIYTAVISINVLYFTTNPVGNLTTSNSGATVTVLLPNSTQVKMSSTQPYFTLSLNTTGFSPLSSYPFKITCNSSTTVTQVFVLTLFPRNINTTLYTSSYVGMTPLLAPKQTITANWTDVVHIFIQYHDDLNNKFIPTSTLGIQVYALIGTSRVDAISNGTSEWRLDINTALAPLVVGGTTLIAIRASPLGVYDLAEYLFNLYTTPIVTTAFYLVNGLNQTLLSKNSFQLGSTIHIIATEYTSTRSVVFGSTVSISFNNATNLAQASIIQGATPLGNGSYSISILLDTDTFYAQNQFFYLQMEKINYTSIVQPITVRVDPIPVIVSVFANGTGTGSDTLSPYINNKFNFTISLNATSFSTKFLDSAQYLNIAVNVPYLQATFNLTSAGNGVYWVLLDAPKYAGRFPVQLQIYVPQNQSALQLQYNIKTTYQFYIQALQPNNGGVPEWVFWLVFAGLVVVVTWFLLYQLRFKYPPMIRKIMDLRRSVARTHDASKIRPSKVKSREENIYNHYAGIINDYSFLQTRDSRYAAKAPGYAPTPDGKTSLEWEIPAIETPESAQIPQKGLKKAGAAKSYVEVPMPKPAAAPAPAFGEEAQPAEEEQPSAPFVTAPSRPMKPISAPTAPIRPPVKPIGLAALPKPSVAPLKAYRAPIPAAKPAPVAEGGAEAHENLYQQLVLLEQKRYKAERSVRDLDAKHNKGLVNDTDYKNYLEKINGGLEKIKSQISDIRRKLISF